MILNEAYFGKNNTLIECEELLQTILDNRKFGNDSFLNSLKEVKIIEEKLAKLFNVEHFNLSFINSLDVANAFTFNMATRIDGILKQASKFEIIKDSEGFKFKDSKDLTISVFIFTGSLKIGITKEEFMALILHEVGHNFFLNKELIFMKQIQGIVSVVSLFSIFFSLLNSEKIKEVPREQLEMLAEQITLATLGVTSYNKIRKSFIKKSMLFFLSVINVYNIAKSKINNLKLLKSMFDKFSIFFNQCIVNPIVSIPLSAMHKLNSVLLKGYSDEKFANEFAGAYGYSKDIVSVYTKLNRMGETSLSISKKIILKCPKATFLLTLPNSLNRFLQITLDAHPHINSLIEQQLLMLENELKTTKDSKMKSELNFQLKKLRNVEKVLTKNKLEMSGSEVLVYGLKQTGIDVPKIMNKLNKKMEGDLYYDLMQNL